ncbi:ethanolamine kinase 1-like [Lineus longissimus]|uniref:ethanolamine kinase 1-like n=1 Tax=Lineus longissimus TaxID=88925 RepID=UPI002B4D16BD
MAAIPVLDITVDPKNYEEGLRDVLQTLRPAWKRDDIKFKYLTQGYVNHMLACYIDEDNKDDWIVARIFGTDLDFGQQRDVEIKNSKLFAEIGIGAPVYGAFKNGLLFKFIKGKTFFWTDLSAFRDIKVCKAVARAFAKVHCKETHKLAVEKYDIHKAKNMEDMIKEWFSKPFPEVIIDEETTKWYTSQVPTLEERQKEAKMLLERFNLAITPKTYCQGDANPTNLIYDEENDKVFLCDFECAGINQPISDLVSFLGGAASGMMPDPEGTEFSPEFKREFLHEYLRERNILDGEPEEVDEMLLTKYLTQMDIMELSWHYFWHLSAPMLAIAPARHGNDNKFFLKMGISRLEYFRKNRERMMAIVVPE